jgi:hypothetical protein
LDSCQIRDELVRVGIFTDKLKRYLSDECDSVCDRVLLYDKLMCRSVLRAKYFCVSLVINVMVHATITKEIKLKIL